MPDSANQPIDDEASGAGALWRWLGTAAGRRYVGWILVAGGAGCILAGYLGISRQALVAKQLPYLISGGIFGLALVALGTFYLATEQLRRDSGRLDRLELMVAQLHAVLLSRSDAPAPPPAPSPNGLEGGTEWGEEASGHTRLVALPDGRRYHRADCTMVAEKKAATAVTDAVIRRRQLQPCDLCEPPATAALASSAAEAR